MSEIPSDLNNVCKRLHGKIIAISATAIARVTRIEMGLITAVDTGGTVREIDYKQLGYGRKRKRAILFHLYGEKCLKCGATTDLTLDHIEPRNKWGSVSDLENLQILCVKCNFEKDQDSVDYRPFSPASLFI